MALGLHLLPRRFPARANSRCWKFDSVTQGGISMAYAHTTLSLYFVILGGCGLLPGQSAATQPTNTEPRTTACSVSSTVRYQPPRDANAGPVGVGDWYVNADRTICVRAKFRAGTSGNKTYWVRPPGTNLTIIGRRLDASGPLLHADVPCCYSTGFQIAHLTFSSPGCWEVSAKAGDSELKFVTEVSP
jgi:hypothetical protein